MVDYFEREHASELYFRGDWDGCLRAVERFLAGPAHWMDTALRMVRGLIALARNDLASAREDVTSALTAARESRQPQLLDPCLAAFALIEAAAGDRTVAAAALRESLELHADYLWVRESIVALADVAAELGLTGELVAALETKSPTPWRDAALAFARGDYVEAAGLLEQIGTRPDEALARLRAARSLAQEGRPQEAADQLKRALAFYRPVGATYYVRAGEALLAKSA